MIGLNCDSEWMDSALATVAGNNDQHQLTTEWHDNNHTSYDGKELQCKP